MAGHYFYDPRPFYGQSGSNGLMPMDELFYGRYEPVPYWMDQRMAPVSAFDDYYSGQKEAAMARGLPQLQQFAYKRPESRDDIGVDMFKRSPYNFNGVAAAPAMGYGGQQQRQSQDDTWVHAMSPYGPAQLQGPMTRTTSNDQYRQMPQMELPMGYNMPTGNMNGNRGMEMPVNNAHMSNKGSTMGHSGSNMNNMGIMGNMGNNGNSGNNGNNGNNGNYGNNGNSGNSGNNGNYGNNSNTGNTGNNGNNGGRMMSNMGNNGNTGINGNTGGRMMSNMGNNGNTGNNGNNGGRMMSNMGNNGSSMGSMGNVSNGGSNHGSQGSKQMSGAGNQFGNQSGSGYGNGYNNGYENGKSSSQGGGKSMNSKLQGGKTSQRYGDDDSSSDDSDDEYGNGNNNGMKWATKGSVKHGSGHQNFGQKTSSKVGHGHGYDSISSQHKKSGGHHGRSKSGGQSLISKMLGFGGDSSSSDSEDEGYGHSKSKSSKGSAKMGGLHGSHGSLQSYGHPQLQSKQMPYGSSLSKGVELKVPICCDNCERKVRDCLKYMAGVENVLCDQWNRKVVVYGNVQADSVLKRVRKVKKGSELWQIGKQQQQQLRVY